jgi:predicted RNA-binding protein with PIN domain
LFKSESGGEVGREILIDGYNVIKRDTSFQVLEARNLAAARDTLITQLVARYRHTPHRVTVVFDGKGSSEQVMHERRIRIIYSRAGETADSVIARLAAQARTDGREVEMYSDDLEVRTSVTKEGGSAKTTGQLTSQFNAPPAHLKRLVHHRQFVRHKYGLDPTKGKDDEEPQLPRSKRGKKKK